MPFRTGSLSLRRFMVLGQVPASLPQTATLSIRRYSYRPIDDSRGERESFGWVNPRRLLSDAFTYEDITDGGYMLLGLRRDRKNFSKVLFKARMEELIGATKRERKMEKISRQQRLALEDQLTIQMLKETSPQSAFSELVWDMNSNLVLMGATSTKLCERIQEVFEATFDLRLRPMFPALIGADYIAKTGLEQEYFIASAGAAK
jgi:DNA recombination-dependent growth factor C